MMLARPTAFGDGAGGHPTEPRGKSLSGPARPSSFVVTLEIHAGWAPPWCVLRRYLCGAQTTLLDFLSAGSGHYFLLYVGLPFFYNLSLQCVRACVCPYTVQSKEEISTEQPCLRWSDVLGTILLSSSSASSLFFLLFAPHMGCFFRFGTRKSCFVRARTRLLHNSLCRTHT